MSAPSEPILHVRQTTRLFPTFLGLRLLPAGLWFLSAAAVSLGVLPRGTLVLLLPLVLWGTWRFDRYYRAHWGTVRRARLGLSRNWALLLCVVVAYGTTELADPRSPSPGLLAFFVALLFVTTTLLVLPTPFQSRFGSATLLLLFGLGAGSALLISIRSGALLGGTGAVFSLLTGLALAGAGLLDHRQLVRALGAAAEGRGG